MSEAVEIPTGRVTPAGSAYVQARQEVVVAYIAAVALAGALLTIYTVSTAPHLDAFTLAVFCAGAAVAELLRVKISDDSIGVSLSLAVILAALVAKGPAGATLAAIAAALPLRLLQRPRPMIRKTIFNTGLYALGAGAAGLTYQAIGGNIGHHNVDLRDVLACAGALGANFAVNWPLLTGVIHLTTGRRFRDLWHEELSWTGASMLVSGVIGFTLGAAFVQFGWLGATVYSAPLLAMRETMRQYASRTRNRIDELTTAHAEADLANQELTRVNADLDATNEGLMRTLAAVIDARDVYLYGHSVQASRYAGEVARRLELPPEKVREAEMGALLHDIGKIGVSEAILNKPARLTEQEYVEVQHHAEIGYHLLNNLPHFENVAQVVYSHHEHFDGTGYPRRLHGEEIPMAARIVSCVEAVEAMVSDRPYRKGMSADEVLMELSNGAGTQWDPNVVRVFSGMLSKDRKHLSMHNSALEVVLEHSPIDSLVAAGAESGPSLEGLSGTFRSAHQPIFILDEDLCVVSINPAAEQLTGFAEIDVQGRRWSELCASEQPRQRRQNAGPHHVTLKHAVEGYIELEIVRTALRTTGAAYWLVLGRETAEAGAAERVTMPSVLASRSELEKRARAIMQDETRTLTFVLLQMNGYHPLAETFGEGSAQAALGALATVLCRHVGEGNVVASWGEDTFAAMMSDSTLPDATRLLNRIDDALPAACYELDCPADYCSGVAQWDGSENLTRLIERAEVWLQAEKRSRRPMSEAPALRAG
jgi:putative nucleotidyltransferase with HDIG domain/PAS domain S-box-containing protein